MGILLDTHALIWWFTTPRRVPEIARLAMSDSTNNIWVSAASVWEIFIKYYVGRLPQAAPMVDDMANVLASEGFQTLSMTASDAMRAGALLGPLRDPFDRMLIAQSLNHDLTLISNEVRFDSYGVRRLW